MPPRHARSLVLALAFAGGLAACADDRPETLVASGKEFLARNDARSAAIQLKNALQKNPDLAEARFLLGEAMYRERDYPAAEKEYRKALELGYPRSSVNARLAEVMLQKGEFKAVVQTFEGSQGSTPRETAIINTALSQAKLALGDQDGAGRSLAAARAADTTYTQAALVSARLKAGRGDLAGALSEIDAAIATSPTNEAWYLKGLVLVAMRQLDKGAEAFRKSIELDSEYMPAHAALIETLLQANRREDVNAALGNLRKLAPKHPYTYYLQALVALRSNDAKTAHEAAQFFNAAVPNDPKGMLLLATSARLLQLYGETEANVQKVLQADSGNVAARRILIATYLETGRTAKAVEAVQPLLAKGGSDPAILGLAGEVYLRNGDASNAAKYFQKAAALEPAGVEPKTGLSLARIAQGDRERGMGELEALASSNSDSRADFALIATALDTRQYDKALAAIDRLEKKLPKEPAPSNLRGLALIGRGDSSGARKSFEHALSLSPDYLPAAINLARLDMAERKPAEAQKRFDAFLARNPNNVPALLALAGIRDSTRPASEAEDTAAILRKAIAAAPTDAAPRLALVAHYLRLKDPKKAVIAAQEADAAIPRTPQIVFALGQAQRAAGDANQAMATYVRLSQLLPESAEPLLRIADIKAANKDYEGASESLRRALSLQPDLASAERGLVGIELTQDRLPQAFELAREIQKRRANDPAGYVLEGDIHTTRKDWGKAADAFRRALKQGGGTDAAIKLHAVLLAEGKAREAGAAEAAWLQDHSNDMRYRAYVAESYLRQGDDTNALRQYRALLEARKDDPALLNNVAALGARTGDARALDYAEKANALAPNQPAIMDTLGSLLVEKGDAPRGVELLRKASELAPESAEIRLNLARGLIKAGQKDAARKELETLAKLGDRYAGQKEVEKLLKML